MHKCPFCKYSFADEESLQRHLTEGQGCPEQEEIK